MNFFERQHQVRKVSRRLVWLFALAVAAIVTMVDVAAYVGFSLHRKPPGAVVGTLLTVSLVVGLLIGLTSWVRMLILRRGGGGKIARDLGGRREVAALLAALARVGGRDPSAAEAAYRAGLNRVLPGDAIPYQPPGQGITVVDSVWPTLDGLDIREKAVLVESVVQVITHDGAITVQEAELLRTVCAVLHCPLPPMGANGWPTEQPTSRY